MNDFEDDIKGRGLLVSLTIRQWSARKTDKKASKQTADANGADASHGNYRKLLIDKEFLKPMADIARKARTHHDTMTVPWTYEGVGMLPGVSLMEYNAEMEVLRSDFYSAVQNFTTNEYTGAVAAAARKLGSMFDVSEYPSAADISKRFSMETTMSMLPDTAVDDFRVDIPLSVVDKIRNDVVGQYAQMTSRLVESARESLGHLHERIEVFHETQGTDTRAVLYGSTVQHANDSIALLRAANITGDQRIQAALDQLPDAFVLDSLKAKASNRETAMHTIDTALTRLAGGS